MHYLLRKKPYRVMWGGHYVVTDDNLEKFSRTEDLLGISAYTNYEDFEISNTDILNKSYYDKVKFIGANSKLWKRIDVWDEASRYFDWENTRSVTYSGCLLNHTKKLAVDLADYHRQSKFLSKDGEDMAIDTVPVLTETGGGTQIALFDGVSADSTEGLAGEWCGDLLQIVEELPREYKIINCCFSEARHRAQYCYRAFGLNGDGFVLSDGGGKLFEAAALSLLGGRGPLSYIKAEKDEKEIKFIPVRIDTLVPKP
jgi:hypothetical protein